MLYFPNSIYYTIVLLRFRLLFLYYLASSFSLRVLLFLAIVIVYVGAMMVLIGYICAISPNVSFKSTSLPLPLILFLSVLFPFSTSPSLCYLPSPDLASFFYTEIGVTLFVTLFVTLLIVTTQYSSPKGPFRSSRV